MQARSLSMGPAMAASIAAGSLLADDNEIPHASSAAHALCELLNQTAAVFPGTRLRVRFAVFPPPLIGLAFPGTPPGRGAPSAPCPAQNRTS
jgi:hypothetical protein